MKNKFKRIIYNKVSTIFINQKKEILINSAESIKDYINYNRKYFRYNMKKTIMEKVRTVYSLSYSIYNKEKNNLSMDEIKKLIKNSLRYLRYNNGIGYFFIFSKSGERILYPLNPSKEGENILNLKDAKGNYMIKGMIQLINQRGEGFYSYVRPHPLYKDKYYYKISFVKLFEPFDWIIGTGAYVKDFRKKLQTNILGRLNELNLPKDTYFVIFNNGRIIEKSKTLNNDLLENIKKLTDINYNLSNSNINKELFYKTSIQGWNWEIITYCDKSIVVKELDNILDNFYKIFSENFLIIIIVLIILFLLLIGISFKFTNKIFAEINKFKDFFEVLPEKYHTIDENYFDFKEFSDLAKAANKMSNLLNNLNSAKDILIKQITEEKNYSKFIIENVGIGIIILDKMEQIEFANITALKFFNFKKLDDITGNYLHEIMHPIDESGNFIEKENCPVCNVFKTKKNFVSNKITLNLSDKEKTIISILVAPVIKNDKIEKIIISFRDISEEISNKIEIEKFKRAIEQSPVSIVITDTNGTIEYINPFFCEITGYTPEEIIGKNPSILKTEHNKQLYKGLWQTIKSGKIWEGEFLNRKKDNSLYWERAIISPVFSFNGEITNFIAVKQDITNLKELHKNLVDAKEKAEMANESKSLFLANMSHEIRTPMNAIIGFVDLLLESDIDTMQKKYLELVKKSSENLLNILNEILDFSKFEAGKMQYVEFPFDLRKLIKTQIDIFNEKAAEKDLIIDYYIDENIPDILIGDEVKISQVISNILSNAIKFTNKGKVGIEVKLLSKDDNKCKLEFKIHDTGIGIPEDKKDIIFSSFEQVDTSITKKYGGTGLGLAICSKIVDNYNGKLWVESELGKGSDFFFTMELKISDVKLDEKKIDFDKIFSFENVDILVAEDNITNQLLIKEILKKYGLSVDIANNGIEALKLLSSKNYDLIFMDWHMPEMDGAEVTEILRKIEKNEKIENKKISNEIISKLKNRKFTIIALTAAAMNREKEQLLEIGFDDYLAKPINKTELIKILNRFLHSKIVSNNKKITFNNENKSSIDKSYLKNLVGDDEELIEQLIVSFKKTFKKEIENIELGIKERDFKKIDFSAHVLKGAAFSIGLNNVAKIAETIEGESKKENIEKIKIKFSFLKEIII